MSKRSRGIWKFVYQLRVIADAYWQLRIQNLNFFLFKFQFYIRKCFFIKFNF